MDMFGQAKGVVNFPFCRVGDYGSSQADGMGLLSAMDVAAAVSQGGSVLAVP